MPAPLTPALPSTNPSMPDVAPWSPERQLALMLDLFAAQMDAALREADGAVENLSHAFSELMTQATQSSLTAGKGESHTPVSRGAGAGSGDTTISAAVNPAAAQAVVAMQFYDRLSQRLGHVRYSLSTLAMFMCDPHNSRQRERWQRLQNSLRRLYSSEDERVLFEMMMQGTSLAEALERTGERKDPPVNNVELF